MTFGIGVLKLILDISDLSSWQNSSVLICNRFLLFLFLPSTLLLIISEGYNDVSSIQLLQCKCYIFDCTHIKLLMRVLWVGVLRNLGLILQKWLYQLFSSGRTSLDVLQSAKLIVLSNWLKIFHLPCLLKKDWRAVRWFAWLDYEEFVSSYQLKTCQPDWNRIDDLADVLVLYGIYFQGGHLFL